LGGSRTGINSKFNANLAIEDESKYKETLFEKLILVGTMNLGWSGHVMKRNTAETSKLLSPVGNV
jgi:hypothetical protein